jgi:hypothetical protein
MALQGQLVYTSHEDSSQFYQSSNTNSIKFSCEYCEGSLHVSLKCGELEGLKRDVTELTHATHHREADLKKDYSNGY